MGKNVLMPLKPSFLEPSAERKFSYCLTQDSVLSPSRHSVKMSFSFAAPYRDYKWPLPLFSGSKDINGSLDVTSLLVVLSKDIYGSVIYTFFSLMLQKSFSPSQIQLVVGMAGIGMQNLSSLLLMSARSMD
jgi:hypothetical protein